MYDPKRAQLLDANGLISGVSSFGFTANRVRALYGAARKARPRLRLLVPLSQAGQMAARDVQLAHARAHAELPAPSASDPR
jgi:hypothetical protein